MSHCDICQVKSEPGQARSSLRQSGSTKSIALLANSNPRDQSAPIRESTPHSSVRIPGHSPQSHFGQEGLAHSSRLRRLLWAIRGTACGHIGRRSEWPIAVDCRIELRKLYPRLTDNATLLTSSRSKRIIRSVTVCIRRPSQSASASTASEPRIP